MKSPGTTAFTFPVFGLIPGLWLVRFPGRSQSNGITFHISPVVAIRD